MLANGGGGYVNKPRAQVMRRVVYRHKVQRAPNGKVGIGKDEEGNVVWAADLWRQRSVYFIRMLALLGLELLCLVGRRHLGRMARSAYFGASSLNSAGYFSPSTVSFVFCADLLFRSCEFTGKPPCVHDLFILPVTVAVNLALQRAVVPAILTPL